VWWGKGGLTINTLDGDYLMEQRNVQVISVPWDEKSSYMRGCADAPDKIRDAYNSESANRFAENGHNLGKEPLFQFAGTAELSSGDHVLEELEAVAAKQVGDGFFPLFLGGDHAITYPLVKGVASKYEGLNILHFDAHPDLYDQLYGDRYSHACPFVRIMEGGLAKRLVSVGIRTMTDHQKEQARRFNVEIIDMRNFDPAVILKFDGPVYLSLDLDVLDPAYAPGISHHEPGGLTTRELIGVIQRFQGDLVAADIVEYNPQRDIQGVTAMVAAKLMKEIAARFFV